MSGAGVGESSPCLSAPGLGTLVWGSNKAVGGGGIGRTVGMNAWGHVAGKGQATYICKNGKACVSMGCGIAAAGPEPQQ